MCKVYKLVNFIKRMTLKKAENPWQNPARDFACLSGSLFLDESQQDEVQDKQSGDHPQDGMDLLGFALADLHDAIEDEAGGNAVGNAVAQSHEHACKESGNSLVKVVPFYLLEGGHHHDAHHHQGGSCGSKGDSADEGGQEGAESEAKSHDHTGQTGAAAGADAGGTLHISGGVASAEDSANGSGGGISEQCTVDVYKRQEGESPVPCPSSAA